MPSTINSVNANGSNTNAMTTAVREVFSAELWLSALPVLRLDQFTTRKTELGTTPGTTITLPKLGALKRGGPLTENKPMETRSMSLSSQSISVREVGNAVGFSEFLLRSSFYDQMAAATLLLGRDMALVLEEDLRNTAVSAASVTYPNNKTARIQLTSVDKCNTDVLRGVSETLTNNNSPKWGNDYYIIFAHPHQGAGIKKDNDWYQASEYAGSTQIFTGEIGRFDDCRVVLTTMMPNGANNTVDNTTGDYEDIGFSNALRSGQAGNQTHIYQGVGFGEYSIGHATGLPPELRDNGVTDYQRQRGIAWYGIWGTGLLDTKNIVTFETA